MTTHCTSARQLLLACTLVACSAPERDPGMVVRDSAGITIIENAAPAWTAEEGWRVAAEPALDLGTAAGAQAYLFDGVLGARRLDDGRIVVVDGGSGTLRWFDADGAFLLQRGGWGGGPEEFEWMSAPLASPGPDPLVVRATQNRYALLDGDGRRSAVHLPLGVYYIEDPVRLPDGRWLAWDGWTGGVPDTSDRYPRMLLRIAADGGAVDTLGIFADIGQIMPEWQSRRGMVSISANYAQYGGRTDMEVVGQEVVLATAFDHQVIFMDAEAAPRRIVRWPGRDLTVTQADRDAYVDWQVDNARRRGVEDLARVRAGAERLTVANRHAAYWGVRTDGLGNLWLRRADPLEDWGGVGEAHKVVDSDGRLLGPVRMPVGARLLQAGPDWVLLLERDTMDVEHVRLYALEK